MIDLAESSLAGEGEMTAKNHTYFPQYVRNPGGTSLRNLTVVLGDCDQVRDLTSGALRADGLSLTALSLPVEGIVYRFTSTSKNCFPRKCAAACAPESDLQMRS